MKLEFQRKYQQKMPHSYAKLSKDQMYVKYRTKEATHNINYCNVIFSEIAHGEIDRMQMITLLNCT